jgi:hypothetical protein
MTKRKFSSSIHLKRWHEMLACAHVRRCAAKLETVLVVEGEDTFLYCVPCYKTFGVPDAPQPPKP